LGLLLDFWPLAFSFSLFVFSLDRNVSWHDAP
jgi:hypothetical protein